MKILFNIVNKLTKNSITHINITTHLLSLHYIFINNLHFRLSYMHSMWNYILQYLEIVEYNLNK